MSHQRARCHILSYSLAPGCPLYHCPCQALLKNTNRVPWNSAITTLAIAPLSHGSNFTNCDGTFTVRRLPTQAPLVLKCGVLFQNSHWSHLEERLPCTRSKFDVLKPAKGVAQHRQRTVGTKMIRYNQWRTAYIPRESSSPQHTSFNRNCSRYHK